MSGNKGKVNGYPALKGRCPMCGAPVEKSYRFDPEIGNKKPETKKSNVLGPVTITIIVIVIALGLYFFCKML